MFVMCCMQCLYVRVNYVSSAWMCLSRGWYINVCNSDVFSGVNC